VWQSVAACIAFCLLSGPFLIHDALLSGERLLCPIGLLGHEPRYGSTGTVEAVIDRAVGALCEEGTRKPEGWSVAGRT